MNIRDVFNDHPKKYSRHPSLNIDCEFKNGTMLWPCNYCKNEQAFLNEGFTQTLL